MRFKLVYAVYNTVFFLTSQTAQVQSFQMVASHLMPNGLYVLHADVPNLTLFETQSVSAHEIDIDRVVIGVMQHRQAAQQLISQQVVLQADGIHLYPVVTRYAWPAELDLMAELAGLRLRARWAGWAQEPFGDSSRTHVSVYTLAAAEGEPSQLTNESLL
jgi:hypothetical protein